LCAIAACTLVAGQTGLPAAQRQRIDTLAQQALARYGAPSASIAVIENDQLVYAQAYGAGRIEPKAAATPGMRYSIGSISKQFTAAAVMKLVEQGKVKLDDPLAKYLPGFTRGNEVTVRELLSHTSGYEDYAPQDYMIPAWLKPTTPQAVVNHWARLPLNFEPGTQWQYSNTNFKLAGLIVEKISGEPFFQFLSQTFFQPLGMTGVLDVSAGWLGPSDAQGTVRHALGPDRVAPIDGTGWNFADGQLGMTAANLARWQIGMLKQSVLKPASYRAMETNTALKNGRLTGYGLGLSVGERNGHRFFGHSGEEIGFTAQELEFPDDHAAVAVLTNQSANATASALAGEIADVLLATSRGPKPGDAAAQQAEAIFLGLQQGKIDRSLFTSDANFYFNATALGDYAASLGRLGAPLSFTQTGEQKRGGMTYHAYAVTFPDRSVTVTTYVQPDGKIEQFLVFPR